MPNSIRHETRLGSELAKVSHWPEFRYLSFAPVRPFRENQIPEPEIEGTTFTDFEKIQDQGRPRRRVFLTDQRILFCRILRILCTKNPQSGIDSVECGNVARSIDSNTSLPVAGTMAGVGISREDWIWISIDRVFWFRE